MSSEKTAPKHTEGTPWRWTGPRAIGLYLVLMALVFSIVGFFQQRDASLQRGRAEKEIAAQASENNAQTRRNTALITCLSNWGTELVAVLDQRTGISNPRLDKLFGTFKYALAHPREIDNAREMLREAIRLNNAYKKYSVDHPLPIPELHCEFALPSHKKGDPTATVFVTRAPRTVVRTATRTHVETRTAVRTQTVTAPGPVRSSVRTVSLRGPVRTRTIVRTRTVSASPPCRVGLGDNCVLHGP